MGTLTPISLKKDYKNRDFLDYNRWNADQQAIEKVANKLISSTEEGDSGADNIKMTPITEISADTDVQTFLKSLVALLFSANAAGKIGANAIEGLTGENVQALLESLKAAVNACVKTDTLAKYDGTGGSALIGSQQAGGLVGTTVFQQLVNLKKAIDQIVAGQIPIGSIDKQKLDADIAALLDSIGTATQLTTEEKATLVAAINEINDKAGVLSNLTTVNKTSLVGAVNEIKNDAETHQADYMANAFTRRENVPLGGDLNTITTTGTYGLGNVGAGEHLNAPDIEEKYIFNWGRLDVVNRSGSVTQKINATDNTTWGDKAGWVFERVSNTNGISWSEWRRILNTDDYDTLFQFANDGKTAVANAVTAMGVSVSPSDTFATLASKIGQIEQLTIIPGDVVVASSNNSIQIPSSNWGKIKEIRINKAGTYRVSFAMGNSSTSVADARVYINGIGKGIVRYVTESYGGTIYIEDFTGLRAGDLVQIYAKCTKGSVYVGNFEVSCNIAPDGFATVIL